MRLLVGIDGSRYASAAVRFVTQHLARAGAQVDLIHVVAGGAGAPPKPQVRPKDQARHRLAAPESWLRQAQRRLEVHGFKVSVRMRGGVPARVIPTLAGRRGYDLVVVGAKGRSDIPFLDIGSVALATLEHAPTNVLLVREREPKRRKKQRATKLRPLSVLFATDGSTHSLAAIRTFFDLFNPPQLEATAVAVADEPAPEVLRRLSRTQRDPVLRQIRDAGREWLREAAATLADAGVRPRVLSLSGRPASALVVAAGEGASGLMVLGSRGVARSHGRSMGSVALEVARTAPCSVLVARRD